MPESYPIEFDFPINVHRMIKGEREYVENEISTILKTIREYEEPDERIITKIILETCYLNDNQKKLVCKWAKKYGADFVKTSTGFGPGGATLEDVQLMKDAAHPLEVKAAGGIKSFDKMKEYTAAGVTRIGTSSGPKIMMEALKAIGKTQKLREYASMIDHTNLRPEADDRSILNTCWEAKTYDFKAVCVRPEYMAIVVGDLKRTEVKPCIAIGFENLKEKDRDGLLGTKRYDVDLDRKLYEVEECMRVFREITQ